MNSVLLSMKKANEHIDNALVDHNRLEQERIKLTTLTKEELIEQYLALKYSVKSKRAINIEKLVYAILCDPECAWLTYDIIASLIQDRAIPGVKTTANNIGWYNSQAIDKGYDTIALKPKKDITKALMGL